MVVCTNSAFKKEKPDSDNKQLITSGFEIMSSASIAFRENQIGRKVTNPTGLPKPALTALQCCSAKKSPLHIGNFESSHVAVNEINEHTLVTLHCLLTV